MPHRVDGIVLLALAAILCLLAMVAITLATGVSQETFELVDAPARYAAGLRAHPDALRALFALDSVFLVLYAAFFTGLARRIATSETRTLLAVAVGAVLLTALLDMVEDHHVLAMLRGVERGSEPGAAQLAFQHTLSQAKFNVSYLGLFLFGLGVPRARPAGAVLAALLTAGTVTQGAWLYAAPDRLLPLGNLGRWISFVVGFALAIAVARTPPGPAAGAASTGARA